MQIIRAADGKQHFDHVVSSNGWKIIYAKNLISEQQRLEVIQGKEALSYMVGYVMLHSSIDEITFGLSRDEY
jgi:hypothetical protein